MMLSENLKYFIVYLLPISLHIIMFLFHMCVIVILNWCSIYKSTVHLIMKSWHYLFYIITLYYLLCHIF